MTDLTATLSRFLVMGALAWVKPLPLLSAKHGPEGDLPKEGQYTLALLELAKAPPGSDYEDSVLCPNL